MSRDPRLRIARRDLAALSSEKTIVLAIVIQLFVAGFSSFLVVGLVSMYDPTSIEGGSVGVGVAGDEDGDLVRSLAEVDGIDAVQYGDGGDALEHFQRNELDAVLLATRTDDGRIHVQAIVPDSGVRSTLVVTRLRDGLQHVERTERSSMEHRLEVQPLDLPEGGSASPYFGFTYTVLVPLLIFLPVFISGSIAVDSVSEELDRGTLELLLAAPVTILDVVDGKLLAAAGLAPLQAALWLGLLHANGIAVGNVLAILLLVTATAAAVVAIGLAIALLAPDRRQGQIVYSVGVLSVFVVAGLLPEQPANTVAKLAIDSPTTTTWLLVAGYVLGGFLALALVRSLVGRISPDQLGGER